MKLSLAPLPAPCTTPNTAPLQKTPKYRGAMIGSLRGEEESSIREFAEEWRGNLVRCQFGGGGANTPEQYRKLGEAQMAALDRKLEFFHKYGVKVVIDLHSADFRRRVRRRPLGPRLRTVPGRLHQYGWDWTYHAYREWPGWSAEHSADPADMKRHKTTPRKEMLIRYLQRNRAE